MFCVRVCLLHWKWPSGNFLIIQRTFFFDKSKNDGFCTYYFIHYYFACNCAVDAVTSCDIETFSFRMWVEIFLDIEKKFPKKKQFRSFDCWIFGEKEKFLLPQKEYVVELLSREYTRDNVDVGLVQNFMPLLFFFSSSRLPPSDCLILSFSSLSCLLFD